MAPMRAMAEAMGYTFSYNAVTGTAVCTKSGSAIEVSVDSTWATVNGKTTDGIGRARRASMGESFAYPSASLLRPPE